MSILDLIPLPVRIGVLITVIAGAGVAGWTVRGTIAERDIANIVKDIAQQREKAAADARADEQRQQEKVNEALRKQNETLAGINGRLAADIDRLRQRPERPTGVSEAPRADCTGANGAELGASDAIFLRRYASACARIDAALAACYEVVDAK